jgi:transposase
LDLPAEEFSCRQPDRSQSTLFPEHLDDYIAEGNPVRIINVFVDELDLKELGFDGMQPEATGRPGSTVSRARSRT